MSDPQYEAYLREGDQREENLRLRAEIERLRADNETLRQMLKTLTEADPQYGRHALEGK